MGIHLSRSAVLSAKTFWSFLRGFSRLARSPSVGIIDHMVATMRTQRRYDHRLRDLVRTTGDIELATRIGVPRSTARGRLVAFYVEEHNTNLPHSAFHGHTPDEIYFGTGSAIPDQLKSARETARQSRKEVNRSTSCPTCELELAILH